MASQGEVQRDDDQESFRSRSSLSSSNPSEHLSSSDEDEGNGNDAAGNQNAIDDVNDSASDFSENSANDNVCENSAGDSDNFSSPLDSEEDADSSDHASEPEPEPYNDPDPDPPSEPDSDDDAGDGEQPAENNMARRENLIYYGEEGRDCPITLNEGTLLIMSFAMRFGLSDLAIENLLQLLNCHMPVDAYSSLYNFQKEIPAPPLVQRNYYCPGANCRRPISFQERENFVVCQCNFECEKEHLNKLQSYYLSLPLKEQLISLLKDDNVFSKLRWEDRSVSDVISGQFYRDRINDGTIRVGRDITLQFNTDGAQIFKSSSLNVWPIQVMINELPYNIRKNSIILCGLWYGSKPNMNTFLDSFIRELTSLHQDGFHIPHEPPRHLKVHTILSSVDSVARAPMQGLKQFSGMYGCSFCLHPGEYTAVGRGGAVLYPGGLGPLRTARNHRLDTIEYNRVPRARNFHIQGVKGTAALLVLPVFNIIDSFVPDYLHAVLLGVVETMVEHWTSVPGQWYIGNDEKIDDIDRVLLTIKPPCEITRTPRTFYSRHLWRGHEWKNFLLYYSIPCLKAVNFPAKYLNHWFLLVYGISCFLRDHITDEDYARGTAAINEYVRKLSAIYSTPVLMKFNTHLLLHIPKSVKDFGALWAWSTFKYEHYNGFLAKMFKSSQSAQLQICKNYVRFQGVAQKISELYNEENDIPPCISKALRSLGTERTSRHVFVANDNLKLLGVPISGSLSLVKMNVVQQLFPNIPIQNNNVRFYKRFLYKHVLYHRPEETQVERSMESMKLSNDENTKREEMHLRVITAK
ncbi:Halomucin [Frankliniella fusca]|uniref:Halomucin n=1 Tax=Frankliniella fusca TaxID=407009 RepID=A0AAE1HFX0_9NEOP|nr:Halomucin [Frankliniella fusca]